jgi:hypothetical protein
MSGKIINLDFDAIKNFSIKSLDKYVCWHEKNAEFFHKDVGKEHYKLLAYLSSILNEKLIIDIGTYFGFSAIALSFNAKTHVITYDVCDWIPDEETNSAKTKENITCKITNCINDIEDIVKSNLIVIDIDPHDGYEESLILDALRKNKYKGLVIISDILLNEDIKAFWNSIPEDKYDISHFGHWTGTGIVIFDPSNIKIVFDKN